MILRGFFSFEAGSWKKEVKMVIKIAVCLFWG
jgi:hypothetical protein